MVALLVQTFCFVFVIFCGFTNANEPVGNPKASSGSSFSAKSYSSSSVSSKIPVDCVEDKCDRNSTYKECPNPCPKTCGNPNGVKVCSRMCLQFGCECKTGYVVSENGKCVKLEDCPDYLRCNDGNATFNTCPSACPRTCELPGGRPCTDQCMKEGCECKQGFYLDNDNKCVALQDCSGANKCSCNETFVFCNVGCPTNECPEDDNQGIIACDPPYPCGSGCSCKKDYLRSKDGRCILYSDCPPIICTRQNEIYSSRPPPCLFESCNDIGKVYDCQKNYPNRPQCICKPDFYRNDDGLCVPENECPKPPLICGENEIPVKCKILCPPQFCDIAYTDYYCTESPCTEGCDCRPDYLRDFSGICIPNDQCPPPPVFPACGANEIPTQCKLTCPPQSCASLYTLYNCLENITCELGCNCEDGYLRDANGVCIPSKQCPNTPPEICGVNEVLSKCKVTCPPDSCDSIFTSYLCSSEQKCEPGCNCASGYLRNEYGICVLNLGCDVPPECRPTCANPEPNCTSTVQVVFPPRRKGQEICQCDPGYILSEINGTCIRIEECPDEGCNCDPFSKVTSCPWPYPSTCENPEAGSNGRTCEKVGCQCKPNYILSEYGGECILPDDCECGNPCGENGTFSECAFRCPNQYCPEDDSLIEVACKPGRPCPSGCNCKPYYLRTSYDNETCVLASDCPPITCTRPFEKYDPCSSECLAENCDDLITDTECYADPLNCQPRCVCIDGYYRNKSGICVPEEECPQNCKVQQECRPTCAVPNPPNCPYIPPAPTNIDSCNCQSGFVLSEFGGTCIKIEDCPKTQSCNGDSNAFVKQCPLPCPSTCDSPNAFPCKKRCLEIGCECNPGFLKSENGSCILPNQCPGGNPCGMNATFTPCKFNCPTNFCPFDDSRAVITCETSPFAPCFSGCSCRLNYRLKSREDPRCIVSTDCPEVNCTRPKEIFDSCPSACLSEYCNAVDISPTPICNTLVYLCDPKCVCRKGYFRNDKDICVSSSKCRRLNRRKKKNHS